MKTKKQLILDAISDLAARFLYYDREEDIILPIGSIEQAVLDDNITVTEIMNSFMSPLMISVMKAGRNELNWDKLKEDLFREYDDLWKELAKR